MKTKAKLILAMSVLTAGVVAAGATGTFAWFTTNRAAQLTYTSVTAQKNAGNLDVVMGVGNGSSLEAGDPATVGEGQSIAKATGTASGQVSDVSSSDGISFCKPIWQTVAGNGKTASSFKAGQWGVDYVMFWFSVKNSGNNPLDVYLNKDTAIKPKVDTDKNDKAAAKYTRVSIIPSTDTNSDEIADIVSSSTNNWLLENDTPDTNQKYIALPAEGDRNTAAEVNPVDLLKTTQSFVLSSPLATIRSTGNPDTQKLCRLAKNEVSYFVVSVWLEGTKGDGTSFDDAATGQVDVTLDLAGVEATGA